MRIWDAGSGDTLAVLKGHSVAAPGQVFSCAFSPDGSRLASVSGGWSTTVKIWDAGSGKKLAVLKGHCDTVTSCAFSPDGSRIVSSSRDGTLRIWDARSGRTLAVLEVDRIWPPDPSSRFHVTSCAFSPDGSRIVSGVRDGTLRIWDAQGGEELAVLKGHSEGVTSCSFSHDCSRIVSSSRDGTMRIWDAQSGEELAVLKGHRNEVTSCAFSPEGSVVMSGGDDATVRIWDSASGVQCGLFIAGAAVDCCAFSPMDSLLCAGDESGSLLILELRGDAAARPQPVAAIRAAVPATQHAWRRVPGKDSPNANDRDA